MFKFLCINILFAFCLVWVTEYILVSIVPDCYESQENTFRQDMDCKGIKDVSSVCLETERPEAIYNISSEENRKAHAVLINQNINLATLYQQYICKQWAVVISISNPSSAVRQIASDNKWCLVIVADINSISKDAYLTALGYSGSRIVFLSVADQDILFPLLSTAIPWGHIGRKNVGYLFAIHKGAELIWDFDYNNQGVLDVDSISYKNTMIVLQRCSGHHKLFNPYPYFGVNETYIWPRGFPLKFARDRSTIPELCKASISLKSIGVIQVVADQEPDVDATFRFTRKYPITFETTAKVPFILVPQYSYCPFNERATLWTKQAFRYMVLPTSVHSRVSDIWRSYIAQLFFHGKDMSLVFSPPCVVQAGSDHNILEDFQAEIDMYQRSLLLIDFLHTFQFQTNITLEYLYEELYRRHFIQLDDVSFIRIWTKTYTAISENN